MSKIAVYQIYYDQATKAQVQPNFIPLDNTANARPDWYEFWVILKFLRENKLQDDTWYAFLSPKFTYKTGFDSRLVLQVLNDHARHASVVLLSPSGIRSFTSRTLGSRAKWCIPASQP